MKKRATRGSGQGETSRQAELRKAKQAKRETTSSPDNKAKTPNAKLQEGEKPTCKRIVYWMYKGGVAKTTTLLHVAAYMASLGYKVLVVDADGQANATQHLSPEESNFKYVSYEAEGELQTGRHGVTDGVDEVPGCQPQDPRLILHGNPDRIHLSMLLEKCKGDYTTFTHILRTQEVALSVNTDRCLNDNLYLLPGHPDITNFEEDLTSGSEKGVNYVRTQTALDQILTALEQKHGFDYVFLDMGPSSSALNGHCAAACDYIQPVSFHDSYSLQAIDRAFTKVLPEWHADHKRRSARIQETMSTTPSQYVGLRWRDPFPTVLPVILTNYDSTMVAGKSVMRYNDACLLGTMRIAIKNMMCLKYGYKSGTDSPGWRAALQRYEKQDYAEERPPFITPNEVEEYTMIAKRMATVPWYTDQFFYDGEELRTEDMLILSCRKFTSALLPVAHELGRTIPELEYGPSEERRREELAQRREGLVQGREELLQAWVDEMGDFGQFMAACIKQVKLEEDEETRRQEEIRRRGRRKAPRAGGSNLLRFAKTAQIADEAQNFSEELQYAVKQYGKIANFIRTLP